MTMMYKPKEEEPKEPSSGDSPAFRLAIISLILGGVGYLLGFHLLCLFAIPLGIASLISGNDWGSKAGLTALVGIMLGIFGVLVDANQAGFFG